MSKAGWGAYRKIEHYGPITTQRGVEGVGEIAGMTTDEKEQV